MAGNDSNYPRDLKCYGGQPPDPRWPGDERVAVSIVVAEEAGDELSLADGDPLMYSATGSTAQRSFTYMVTSVPDYGTVTIDS